MDVIIKSEDQLSEAVLKRLIKEIDRNVRIHLSNIEGGTSQIRAKLRQYCQASKAIPHIILVDLDRYKCPLELLNDFAFVPRSHQRTSLRVAVKEIETWILADRRGLATFLQVPLNKIPFNPESLNDPKRALVNIARKSNKGRLRQELLPSEGSASQIGIFYNAHFSNFAADTWHLEAACENSPSLRRSMESLRAFIQRNCK